MSLIIPSAPQFSLYESNVWPTPGSSDGISVTNPVGGANTKNTTWTELIASTAFDAQLVIVGVNTSHVTATDTSTLLDIGIGAAAAETVVIPDLLAGNAGQGNVNGRYYIFPLRIPTGSRISGRTASVRTTGGVTVLVLLYGGPRNPDRWWSGTQVTAYGINTADSGAVAVTAGNSGAETTTPVAIGTTTSDHEAIVFGAQLYGTATTALYYRYDVGIDTASTSWLARDTFFLQTDTAERLGHMMMPCLPVFAHVKSGSVLVSGGECSSTAEAAFDIALYGVS